MSFAHFIYRYVPNELRGGMISLSLAPANAAILLCLIQVCSSMKVGTRFGKLILPLAQNKCPYSLCSILS